MASSATASNATLHLGFLAGSPPTEASFGILRASVPEAPSAFDAVHWVFTIDQSGSMDDLCKDGKTKISHIRQTITHIVDFLLESTQETGQRHYVSVVGFSNTATSICATQIVNSAFVCGLPTIVGGFRPSGTTSFEAALPLTSEALSAPLPDVAGKRVQRVNVFMTDGHITAGTKDVERLKALYRHHSVPHVFVGFGTDYASSLLEALADVPRGSHFFVESIENAGLVYGEIIHGCLHEMFQEVELRGNNLEIYDFKANAWTSTLCVPKMPSGKDRVWQVRARNGEPSAALHYTLAAEGHCEPLDVDGAAAFALAVERDLPETAPSEHVLQALPFPSECPHGSPIAIKKYWWRQRSQELVARVRESLAKRRASPAPRNPRALCRQGNGLRTGAPVPCTSTEMQTDANLLLDSAKQGRWNIVELIVASQPDLVNVRPEPRRFNLIHHAVHQGDSTRTEWLLNAGADPSLCTSDGITCRELAERVAPALVDLFLTSAGPAAPPETLQAELDTFLADLKQYMRETPGLETDAFLLSLCDDIYVSILGMGSNLGEMFVAARQASSGNERAYNMQDIDALQRTSTALAADGVGRLLSDSTTTTHAPPGAVRIMRSCSGALPSRAPAPSLASSRGNTAPNTAAPPPVCSVTLRRPSRVQEESESSRSDS
tara:strand:- start:2749 stop:4740 length:1992 start_codon:yes stop_codon:yes gene_type:complete